MLTLPLTFTRNAPQGGLITSGVPTPGAEVRRALKVGKVNKEARTVELSFSSDVEYKRWPGFIEVLSHDKGAVDLDRLNSNGPFLFNHNLDDVIGVIESATIGADGKGRALVRFSKSERGEWAWNEVQDGILSNISVGYRINAIELKEQRDGGDNVYLVTAWEPFEISLVTAPADTSVGVGRSIIQPNQIEKNKRLLMNRQQMLDWLSARGITPAAEVTDEELLRLVNEYKPPVTPPAAPPAPGSRAITTGNESTDAAVNERQRAAAITALGKRFNLAPLAERAVSDGSTVEAFRTLLIDEVGKRETNYRNDTAPLGLGEREKKSFSILKLIRVMADPTDKAARRAAEFEIEVCSTAAEKRGKETRGFYVPNEVLATPLMEARRDVVSVMSGAGYTGTGGNLVATQLLTSSFWEILRNKALALRLFTPLTGLVGNVDIPYQTQGATANWLGAEDDEAENTDVKFGIKSMDPKTLAAYAEITRKMLMQPSLDVEAFVRADIARGMGLKLDYSAFYGEGDNGEPLGIRNVTGIQYIDFTATNPDWEEIVAMETEVEADNIDPATARYIHNARMKGYFKTTKRFADDATSQLLWEGNGINGYTSEITNQVKAGELFFGDFGEVLYGTWGGVDILTDPYTHSNRGRIRVTSFMDADFQHRRVEALAWGKKASESGS